MNNWFTVADIKAARAANPNATNDELAHAAVEIRLARESRRRLHWSIAFAMLAGLAVVAFLAWLVMSIGCTPAMVAR